MTRPSIHDEQREFVRRQAQGRLDSGQPLFGMCKLVWRRPSAEPNASIGPWLAPRAALRADAASLADPLGQYHDLWSLSQGEFDLPKGL